MFTYSHLEVRADGNGKSSRSAKVGQQNKLFNGYCTRVLVTNVPSYSHYHTLAAELELTREAEQEKANMKHNEKDRMPPLDFLLEIPFV